MVKLLLATSLAVASAVSSVQAAAWDVLALNATNAVHEPVRRLALQCDLQTNVDFAGNDLANTPGASPSDCCAKCSGVTGCKAFSWTNYQGGTCWLKSGKGTVTSKSGVVSAEVSQSSDANAVCSTELNVDYVGNDVGSAVAAVSDCCAKCSAIANCGAYTWSNYQGGTCWFKSGKGTTKASNGVVSGVVSRTPATCNVENDVDYVANDLSNVPGQASECCAKCTAVTGCNAYTWSNNNGGTCWLKTAKGATKAATGLVSGVVSTVTPTTPPPTTVTPPPTTVTPPPTTVTPPPTTVTPPPTTVTPPPTTVTPPPSQQCTVETDVDYVGNDLTSVIAPASDCCAKCRATANCGAYTWSNYNGGTCWLKTAKGTTKSITGVISGVVTSATPLPTTPAPTTVTPAPTTPGPTTVTPPNEQCKIEKGVDYVGNDITNVPGADSTACCSKCLDVDGCNAFSWAAGVCYLKSSKGATSSNANVESGVVSRPPPTNSCSIEENVNFVGLDIATRTAATAEECCGICASYSGCGAFTWTTFNGGTCWLKSDRGQTTTVTGSRSARVVVANRPRTHIQYSLRSRAVKAKSVNLGNWLVGEYWLWYTSPAWTNVWNIGYQGEYLTMKARGHSAGDPAWKLHRDQWITEDDIRQIAAAGLNSVRVPVGYWIVGDDSTISKNYDMSVHAPGALKYLDVLINEWAYRHNVAVILSLHAHMGSQNGFDHSAPRAFGQVQWGWGETFDNSIQFSTFLAARYKLSPAFLGMSLMNEPNLNINQDAMKEYYRQSYAKIRATGNDCILITSPHLNDQGPYAMGDFMTTGYYNVWHEWHVYFKWGDYAGKNDGQLIQAARDYSSHFDGWKGNPIYMGEWSLTSPTNTFTNDNSLREFFNAQMEVYKRAGAGWAYWTWKHADDGNMDARGWSLRKMLQIGVAKF